MDGLFYDGLHGEKKCVAMVTRANVSFPNVQ